MDRLPATALRWLSCGLLLAAGWAGAQQSAPKPPSSESRPFTLTEVQPGVYVHVGAVEDWTPQAGGDVANLGVVVGSRCVAVIDTGGTPQVGGALRAAIERIARQPVCYVINTHAHPDHVLGNVAFTDAGGGAAPKFVASARFGKMLSAREPYYQNALRRDFGIEATHSTFLYPTVAVEKSLDIDLGDRVLTLRTWPTAHTDNDLTVYDQMTRTLFAADLLFVRHLPVLDGSLRGWIAVMADMRCLDVKTVVPGHGDPRPDWPGAMDAQAAYLGALLADTRSAIRDLVPIRQATDRIAVSGAAAWRLIDRFHRRNVTAAYSELEWEDDAARASAPPVSTPDCAGDRRAPPGVSSGPT
ncbi:MAG: quinoprotein relay system zinc metallohydrolase 2 [Caldimonas sp.]